jgi:hypothetical protein
MVNRYEIDTPSIRTIDSEVVNLTVIGFASPSGTFFAVMVVTTCSVELDIFLTIMKLASFTLNTPELAVGILDYQIIPQVLSQVGDKYVVSYFQKLCYYRGLCLLPNTLSMPLWPK